MEGLAGTADHACTFSHGLPRSFDPGCSWMMDDGRWGQDGSSSIPKLTIFRPDGALNDGGYKGQRMNDTRVRDGRDEKEIKKDETSEEKRWGTSTSPSLAVSPSQPLR